MNPRISALGAGAALLVTGALVPTSAVAAPSETGPDPAARASERPDDRPDALAQKQRERKQEAVEQVATGEAKVTTRGKGKKKSRVVRIAPGEYVEYGTQETAQLFSILVDFGDGEGSAHFPDAPAGPLHNEIPEPEADDNTTYWENDFSQDHFMDMFFEGDANGESFHDVYDEMSSGRFDLQGDVSDWVTVPNRQGYYGGGDAEGGETGQSMTAFIQDAANAWYEQQVAAGKSEAEIAEYLQSFDVWDRYDADGDGVINEPDGYIDHFQAIHAGEGEEAGAPPWAIWSHRWSVNQGGLGTDGPADYEKLGGVKIGDTDLWIRDYTTEPENGGLGVFAHEFGHDLGLPDYYDTAGGENGTGFWNLMSSGSWMGHGKDSIGGTPNHMGATEKMYLGWLDYETVEADSSGTVDLGPAFHATTREQAALVNLPEATTSVDVGVEPIDGKYAYSTTGNNLNATFASPEFAVPDGGSLSAQVNYEIEAGYDYAFVDISTDGGTTWTALATSESSDGDPNGTNPGGGIDGSSGGWVELTADLSEYAGQNAQIRFRYTSDGGLAERALAVDSVTVGDVLFEDFEDAADWSGSGEWQIATDGKYDITYSHYYLAENRVYGGYDVTLREGPYNFGWAESSPDKVEHFPYQDGLLIWYVNGLYGDNNTSTHPGGGQALPVDADAKPLTFSDGMIARNRIQSFDATFGKGHVDAVRLHNETPEGMTVLNSRRHKQERVFDDSDPYAYYDESNPGHSTIVGGTGTQIRVLKQHKHNGHMTIEITRS